MTQNKQAIDISPAAVARHIARTSEALDRVRTNYLRTGVPSVIARCQTSLAMLTALQAKMDAADGGLAEMTRRRDEWKAKAEGYDDVRLALRDAIAGKFGEDGPRTLSRVIWAGIAADEKKRADDAEAQTRQAVEAAINTISAVATAYDNAGDRAIATGISPEK